MKWFPTLCALGLTELSAALRTANVTAAARRAGNGSVHERLPPLFMSDVDAQPYTFGKNCPRIKSCLYHGREDPKLPRRHQYKTCAVVGASPNSRGSREGPRIDAHEAIFRAGICDPVDIRKYQADVGTRTNFCVTFENKPISPYARRVVAMKRLKSLKPDFATGDCRGRLLLVHPEFLEQVDSTMDAWGERKPPPKKPVSEWREKSNLKDPVCDVTGKGKRWGMCPNMINFSNGFIAVLLALEMCGSVDVYGFDTDENGNAPYGHLHNNIGVIAGPCKVYNHGHPFPLERHMLKMWDSIGRLHLDNSTKVPAKMGEMSGGCFLSLSEATE